VDLQDARATLGVRLRHLDEAVKAPRTQDRLVEHVEAVRGGHDPDLAAVVKAVHLGEQLHHRALNLGVARRLRVRPLGGDGVNLVDEDDSGLAFASELEQVTDESGALADELPDQFGAGHLDEGGVGLVGDRLRQHRLPSPRRAVQEDTARRIDADRLELLGVFERVLDGLADLADLVVDAADVVVGDVRGLGDLHRLPGSRSRRRAPAGPRRNR